MTWTTTRSTFLLATGIAIASFGPASADCQVRGPETMYLGDGGSYSLQMIAHRSGTCSLSFKRQAADVSFSSVEVTNLPKAGKFSGSDAYNLFYTPPTTGVSDSFSLKVCGKDTHGAGCNVLNYAVTIVE